MWWYGTPTSQANLPAMLPSPIVKGKKKYEVWGRLKCNFMKIGQADSLKDPHTQWTGLKSQLFSLCNESGIKKIFSRFVVQKNL
jgi:hypothetical protein